MSKLNFNEEFGSQFGGLVKTTKTYKKKPSTVEEMFMGGLNKQRDPKNYGTSIDWYKKPYMVPKVGVYKLWENDNDENGYRITEDQRETFLDKIEQSFNNGGLTDYLDKVRIKHQSVIDKRSKKKVSNSNV